MPVTFPIGIYAANENWNNLANTQSFVSPLNRKEQTATLAGSQWRAQLPFVNLSKADGRGLRAFIMSLRGKAGTAFVIPYDARTPLGTPSGSPTVNGANQTGGTLITANWANSTTVLKAGDYFEVNGELKLMTADAITNGSGAVTLEFAPDLHTAPPNSDPIVYTNPSCTMRLVNDSQASWQLTQDKYYMINLDFIEAL
jgi:hypothetical protein